MGTERKYIEEVVADQTLLCWDPSIANNEKDSHHINFVWNNTPVPLCMSFIKLVDTELDIQGFALIDPVMEMTIFIRKNVVNVMRSLLDGARVTMLRNSLDRVMNKRDNFLFSM